MLETVQCTGSDRFEPRPEATHPLRIAEQVPGVQRDRRDSKAELVKQRLRVLAIVMMTAFVTRLLSAALKST